jgi:hypothetical protein
MQLCPHIVFIYIPKKNLKNHLPKCIHSKITKLPSNPALGRMLWGFAEAGKYTINM